MQQRHHLAVALRGADGVARQGQAVHLHHQLGEQRLPQQRRAEPLLLLGLLQLGEQLSYPVSCGVVDIAEILLRLPKAAGQIAVVPRQRLQIRRRDVQNSPLVKIPPRHNGPVDAAPSHQHIVPRLQHVPLALDGVVRPPRQQQNDLVKGVVVIGDLLMVGVRQMEQPERLVQIPSLLILQRLHIATSRTFCSYHTIKWEKSATAFLPSGRLYRIYVYLCIYAF